MLFTFLVAIASATNCDDAAELAGRSPLYRAARDHVAPAMIGYTDGLLRAAAAKPNPKIVFIARDGGVPYQIARELLKKYPERYPRLTEASLSYLAVNRHTIRSPLARQYVAEAGIKPGDNVFVADMGWFGTLDRSYAQLFGPGYEGMHLLFAASRSPTVKGYVLDTGRGVRPPGSALFDQIPGNKAVHFLEDTFSGTERRADTLALGPNGRVVAVVPPVGSSRVDLQACKLEYSIVSPK